MNKMNTIYRDLKIILFLVIIPLILGSVSFLVYVISMFSFVTELKKTRQSTIDDDKKKSEKYEPFKIAEQFRSLLLNTKDVENHDMNFYLNEDTFLMMFNGQDPWILLAFKNFLNGDNFVFHTTISLMIYYFKKIENDLGEHFTKLKTTFRTDFYNESHFIDLTNATNNDPINQITCQLQNALQYYNVVLSQNTVMLVFLMCDTIIYIDKYDDGNRDTLMDFYILMLLWLLKNEDSENCGSLIWQFKQKITIDKTNENLIPELQSIKNEDNKNELIQKYVEEYTKKILSNIQIPKLKNYVENFYDKCKKFLCDENFPKNIDLKDLGMIFDWRMSIKRLNYFVFKDVFSNINKRNYIFTKIGAFYLQKEPRYPEFEKCMKEYVGEVPTDINDDSIAKTLRTFTADNETTFTIHEYDGMLGYTLAYLHNDAFTVDFAILLMSIHYLTKCDILNMLVQLKNRYKEIQIEHVEIDTVIAYVNENNKAELENCRLDYTEKIIQHMNSYITKP